MGHCSLRRKTFITLYLLGHWPVREEMHMKMIFEKLGYGNKFIRVLEIDSEAYTPVYRKLRHHVEINVSGKPEVMNAIKEPLCLFTSIPYDEEVILVTSYLSPIK